MESPLRSAALAVSVGRFVFGAVMVARPEQIGEAWIGEPGRYERVAVLTRSVGARDIGLGAGAAAALLAGRDDVARVWLGAQALADVVDLVGTLAVRDRLPQRGVAITAALAAGSALIAGGTAASLSG